MKNKDIIRKRRKVRLGRVQQKILLLLQGGLALGITHNPRKQFRVIDEMRKEWVNIDKRTLRSSIKILYESQMVGCKENDDGTTTIFLTKKGEKRALTFDLENMKIRKEKKWDGRWRFILFDVPEEERAVRNSLRHHFKNIGLYEFQKSVFVCPYDCRDEVEYIVEVNDARKFVRFIEACYVDNEEHLKDFFKMS